MWALIDNYDSFTYILHHYLTALHGDVHVWKNDGISIDRLAGLNPQRIILSPGPRRPQQAGITMDVIRHFHARVPILGICLGHQAIGAFFGAALVRAQQPMHGKTSAIYHRNSSIFRDVPNGFEAMRYHSLVLEHWEGTDLVPLAFTREKELMAFRHRHYPCMGLQFHPESVLTAHGALLLSNWSRMF